MYFFPALLPPEPKLLSSALCSLALVVTEAGSVLNIPIAGNISLPIPVDSGGPLQLQAQIAQIAGFWFFFWLV